MLVIPSKRQTPDIPIFNDISSSSTSRGRRYANSYIHSLLSVLSSRHDFLSCLCRFTCIGRCFFFRGQRSLLRGNEVVIVLEVFLRKLDRRWFTRQHVRRRRWDCLGIVFKDVRI